MTNFAKRIAAVESFVDRADNVLVIAWMIDGASDDDVIAISTIGGRLERQPDEALAALIERGKALDPGHAAIGVHFIYADEAKARLRRSELADSAPNSWPIPSAGGYACHVEHRI